MDHKEEARAVRNIQRITNLLRCLVVINLLGVGLVAWVLYRLGGLIY